MASNQFGGWVAGSLSLGAGDMLIEAHAVDADDHEGGGGEEIFNSSFEQMGGAVRYVVPLGSGRLRASLQLDRVDDLGKAAIDSQAIRAVYPLEDSDRLTALLARRSGRRLGRGRDDALLRQLPASCSTATALPPPTSNRRIDRSDTDARDASLRGIVGREIGGGRMKLGVDLLSRFDLQALVSRVNYDADGTTITSETTSAAIDEASQSNGGLFATWTQAARPTAGRSGSARAATTSTPRIRAASSATAPRAPRRSPATPR